MTKTLNHGDLLRKAIEEDIAPVIGVYDVFSASIAARKYRGLFVSGFSFAASYYGLPDIGFIAWPDIVAFVQRLRAILPEHHILVDIDDGYCDVEVACHVVSLLEAAGASGVVLEDQERPRRCGHFQGKRIMPLDGYLEKLERVLATRRNMVVVARTDASGEEEVLRRVNAFAHAGADVVLADGLEDLSLLSRIRARSGRPVAFNQIAGGKSPSASVQQLRDFGVSLLIYSTPCLFAAQTAIEDAITNLSDGDGQLPAGIGVKGCTAVLQANMERPGLPVASASRAVARAIPVPVSSSGFLEERPARSRRSA